METDYRVEWKPYHNKLGFNRTNRTIRDLDLGVQTTLIRSAFYGNRLPRCMETAYHVVGKPHYKRLGFNRTSHANS